MRKAASGRAERLDAIHAPCGSVFLRVEKSVTDADDIKMITERPHVADAIAQLRVRHFFLPGCRPLLLWERHLIGFVIDDEMIVVDGRPIRLQTR